MREKEKKRIELLNRQTEPIDRGPAFVSVYALQGNKK